MESCTRLFSLLLLTSINSATGVVEISPSPVAPVCQEGDQLELICNTTSGLDHQWKFTVFPENMSYITRPVSSTGVSGIPTTPLMIGFSIITFSRLSGPNILPLVSRISISPVGRGLNGTVVNCVELDTSLVATTTIQIIDSQQFELSAQFYSEYFSSDGVIVILEWMFLNSRMYYQQLPHNVTVSANPQPENVILIGNMSIQLTLSYNTLYNLSLYSICQPLVQTKFLLNYSKCSNPMELTNALVLGYKDPALEEQIITYTCPTGQTLNGSNSSTCMRTGEWEPDPGEVGCLSGMGTIAATTSVVCNDPLYILHINDTMKESTRLMQICVVQGFLLLEPIQQHA